MKLLHTQKHEMHQFQGIKAPQFAVFSSSLVGNQDLSGCCATSRSGCQIQGSIPHEVLRACAEAQDRGLSYIWVASLCVDWASSTDVVEAINASFGWIQNATVCFAYLDDLTCNKSTLDEDAWRKCKYWENPWSLQELVAPECVEFFDSNWNHCGSKSSPELSPLISKICGIPTSVLLDNTKIWETAIALRLAWAAERRGSREEDIVYSLVGLAGVNMSCRYGEGAERAFGRLQQKILKETIDGSIFAWRSKDETEVRGVLAHSPSEFRQFASANGRGQQALWKFDGLIRQDNRGLEIRSRISRLGPYLLMEVGRRGETEAHCERIGIWLREWNGVYLRVNPTSIVKIPEPGGPFTVHVARSVEARNLTAIRLQFEQEENTRSRSTSQRCRSQTPRQDGKGEGVRPQSPRFSSCGVKRDKSGQPKTLAYCINEDLGERSLPVSTPRLETVPSPGPEGDAPTSCSAVSRRDSVSETAGSSLNEQDPLEGKSLDAGYEPQRMLPGLVQSCYDQLQVWLTSNHFNLPLRELSTSRKRARRNSTDGNTAHIKLEQDGEDPELVVVSQNCGSVGPVHGVEPTVALVHRFWTTKGRQCVSQHLLNHGLVLGDGKHEERLVEVSSLTLRSLLDMTISVHVGTHG